MPMTVDDYYKILGLSVGCSVNDLKRAYRIRARQYHPDLNHHPGASDLFIRVTEAYEFLLNHIPAANVNEENYSDYLNQWEAYHRKRARERAEYYSNTRFENFTKSSTYRTTRIFDGTTIIYGLVISLLIIGVDIYSYSFLMSQATSKEDEPSFTFMVLLLVLGLGFFAFAYINLLSFVNSRKKDR
jgi:hypothetical protein